MRDRSIDLANPSHSISVDGVSLITTPVSSRQTFLFPASSFQVVVAALADPLKVMISGAPASGKGTQCELIKTKVSHSFVNSLVCYCIMSYIPSVICTASARAWQQFS